MMLCTNAWGPNETLRVQSIQHGPPEIYPSTGLHILTILLCLAFQICVRLGISYENLSHRSYSTRDSSFYDMLILFSTAAQCYESYFMQ